MPVALGRYELLRTLGRGGMAEVYLARRRGPAGVEKRLVVKRIRPERTGDPRMLELFVREARLSLSLAHANIVPVFDFGRAGDEFFLVMDHVEGRDLGSALDRCRALGCELDPIVVAAIGAEICAALEYAHGRRDDEGRPLGIVHQDIKPANVLLSLAGEVKLADFGVAALAADARAGDRASVRGTPAYMSPEQARGERVDARSDLYSLGLVLWETLAGRRANDASPPSLAMARAREGVVPPLPPGSPEALSAIIGRATAARPDDRYPDARAMHGALEAYEVRARADAPGEPPPSHRLARWLESLGDGEAAAGPAAEAIPALVGPVATFLDDGAAGLGISAAERAGASDVRSRAETAPASDVRSRAEPAPAGDERSPAEAARGGDVRARGGASPADGPRDVPTVELRPRPSPEPAPAPRGAPEAEAGAPAPVHRARGRVPRVAAVAIAVAGLALVAGGTAAWRRAARGGPAQEPARGPVGAGSRPVADAAAIGPIVDAAGVAAGPDDAPPRAVPDAAPARDPVPGRHPGRASPRPDASGAPPPGVATGTLRVSSRPWARVSVDGRVVCEETPCELRLPAGVRVLDLENPLDGSRARVPVKVVAGETHVVSTALTPRR